MPLAALRALKRFEADRKKSPTPSERRLLQLVENGVGTIAEAAERLGVGKGTASKLKRRLQKKGLLAEGRKLMLIEDSK